MTAAHRLSTLILVQRLWVVAFLGMERRPSRSTTTSDATWGLSAFGHGVTRHHGQMT
jgi:hypothetical protein